MWRFLLSTGFAQATASAPSKSGPSMIESLFPIALMLIFFWLFLGRPQQKRMREQQTFLAGLKRGDQVITSGGMVGEITGVTDKFITLEIADNVRVKVLRSQIQSSVTKEGNA